jgi:hypothetical protein
MQPLTHAERIRACETLAADLKAKGYLTKVWSSPAKGVNKPGAGVEIRFQNDPGNVVASATVSEKGYVNFQRLVDSLTSKQIGALGACLTYDSRYAVRPTDLTKVLSQEQMNGSVYRSPLLVKAGLIPAEETGPAARGDGPPPDDVPPPEAEF